MSKYLDKETEIELGRKIQAMLKAKESESFTPETQKIIDDGVKAVETFVENYKNLVYKKACEFNRRFPTSEDVSDIAQEGMCGLMTAIYKYDPDKDCKLSTFASWWILQSITRNSNRNARTIRIPESKINVITKANRIREELVKETSLEDREIDLKVANTLGISPREYSEVKIMTYNPTSYNICFGEDGEEIYSSGSSAFDEFEKDRAAGELASLVSSLSDYERGVLEAYGMLPSGRKVDRRKALKVLKVRHGVESKKIKEDRDWIVSKLRVGLESQGFLSRDYN